MKHELADFLNKGHTNKSSKELREDIHKIHKSKAKDKALKKAENNTRKKPVKKIKPKIDYSDFVPDTGDPEQMEDAYHELMGM